MFRIVLDTNILISAVVFGGKPRKIIESVIRGTFDLYMSKPILDEMAGVLSSKKFKYDKGVVDLIVIEVESLSKIITVNTKITHIVEDPDDNMILECAVSAEADFIVSGDRHLLDIERYNNIHIVSASRFIEMMD